MPLTIVRSREVLILTSLLAVTSPLHRCLAAYVAWDRLVSAGRMLAISQRQQHQTFTSHVSMQVSRRPVSMFTIFSCPAMQSNRRQHDHVPNESQWRQHQSGARFQYCARSANTKAMTPLSRAQSATGWKTLALTKQLQVGNSQKHDRVFCLTCFVDLAF